jgi:exodeoxyribonuclease VII large subunit
LPVTIRDMNDRAVEAQRADSPLPGPFAVGRWAAAFQDFLRERPKVLLLGELTNFRRARANAYFELRDADGAVPCSIWSSTLDRLKIPEDALKDGATLIVGGGPDFYPGTATSSPSFSFRADFIRLAGEGDLLARLAALRKQLEDDGLFKPQKALPRPTLPKTIGVVTARGSKACADLLAGLERRGWRGTIVWADAPVQDRHAAPKITAALTELARHPEIEAAVVCRGGGSLTDLWAFCDENLCRTVAMLRLPVVSAVGHESDRTLIDDVSAVCCSTPTHAAEELVRLDVRKGWTDQRSYSALMLRAVTRTTDSRHRRIDELARGPARAIRAQRVDLHQKLREIRAAATRRISQRDQLNDTRRLVISRRRDATLTEATTARHILTTRTAALSAAAARSTSLGRDRLRRTEALIRAHEPGRTLERGYALIEDPSGEPVVRASQAETHEELSIRFADDAVRVQRSVNPANERQAPAD